MADETKSSADLGEVMHGYWFVAFIDLLGQKNAFLKIDYVPAAEDPEQQKAFIAEVKASVGVIRGMRALLEKFRTAFNSIEPDKRFEALPESTRETALRARRSRVRQYRMSDGIMLGCPLAAEDGHFPMRGVIEIILACATQACLQLAAGRPLRGGVDVGTAIEVDDELFGAAMVKAYVLESTCAHYPRLVVGDTLRGYLDDRAQRGDAIERAMANRVKQLITRDEYDERWMVDYAGAEFRAVHGDTPEIASVIDKARAFAEQERVRFEQGVDPEARKLFDRYSALVRYLERARGVAA
jgi:hypothetical protein